MSEYEVLNRAYERACEEERTSTNESAYEAARNNRIKCQMDLQAYEMEMAEYFLSRAA